MTNLNPKNNKESDGSDQVHIHSASFNERLDQAILLYKEGVADSVTAVQEADQILERLRIDNPAHPLADAYHGATMILIARDKTKPLDKLKWSKKGLKLLDKAVAAAPQDGLIRLLRGKAAYKLPEKYFRRTQTAIEDYTFLIDQEVRQEGILETEEYSQLIYELGEAYRRIGRNQDAARHWKRLENQTQDPELQRLIKQNLQSLEGKPAIETIAYDKPASSMMIGAVGNALQSWAKKKEEEAHRKRRKKKKSRH